jgi:hypothetical protein
MRWDHPKDLPGQVDVASPTFFSGNRKNKINTPVIIMISSLTVVKFDSPKFLLQRSVASKWHSLDGPTRADTAPLNQD